MNNLFVSTSSRVRMRDFSGSQARASASFLGAYTALFFGVMVPLNGEIVVTDLGTTTPTEFEVGNTVLDPHPSLSELPEVFGFRQANTYGQTFTLPAPNITLGKVLIGYGALTGAATETTFTLTVDANNDGFNEITEEFILKPSDITQLSAPYQGIHWLELDVSSSDLALGEGEHSFLLTADSVPGAGNDWLLAPSYTLNDEYIGGNTIGNPVDNTSDTNFAIKAKEEIASLQITAVNVNDAGEFVIDFSGAALANYEVTKSLALQPASFAPFGTPLIVTTSETGIGRATVPAEDNSEPTAFYRIEKR